MPATPAWPPHSLPRLYVEEPLALGASVRLPPQQSHYLVNVMRLAAGDPLKLFDGITGEWQASVEDANRKAATVRVGDRLRGLEAVPDLWFLFAPIKGGRTEAIVEKATELGVARIVPVITERTIVREVKPERLRAHMIEAAEQCERTGVPEFADATPLARLLADWNPGRALLFADARGNGSSLAAPAPAPAAILIGPEGGFTDAERSAILVTPGTRPVSLGPRILRADTAAIAAVAAWMAAVGDWPR